jgi:hypothetical protein
MPRLSPLDPGRFGRVLVSILAIAIAAVAAGCGQRAVSRYKVAGSVTFQGRPVEQGSISFDPLAGSGGDAGLRGIGGGFAPIQGGRYDTALAGRGHAGGPHRVTVVGLPAAAADPAAGGDGADFIAVPPLFPPYERTVDLPRGAAQLDIDVPAP